MNYFQRRKLKKLKKHILHEARHARYMREDVIDQAEIEKLTELEEGIDTAWESGDSEQMENAFDAISDQIRVVYPAPAGSHKFRENVEIIAVALAVALGFRTYFIQPFKIPTGSMQPTLNGIRIDEEQKGAEIMDRFPLWMLGYVATGVRYKEVRAKVSGNISYYGTADNFVVYDIGGKKHKILSEMTKYFQMEDYVNEGDILASGRLLSGDHILVNKMKYNFSRPKRGEIVVFNTRTINHRSIKPDAFYIKRLVGMPGESISLSPDGYLFANNERIDKPAVFNWTFADKYKDHKYVQSDANGSKYIDFGSYRPQEKALEAGSGPYVLNGDMIERPGNPPIDLKDDEYLFFGDNTLSSLDGRYFGGVQRDSVIGPAFAVYWPFVKRAKILRNR